MEYMLKGLNQKISYFTLDSGLKVILINQQEKNNYYISFATKFGSRDTEFSLDFKSYLKMPDGIAHFLEHKVFEEEDGSDPFTYYAKSGASCNASTNFYVTRYYVWGSENILSNLNYLLKFVLSPHFTKENVEKEKGIIEEEIKMYDDYPDWVIDDVSRKNVFKEIPIKEKIAGTTETIKEIDSEKLYACYNTFYQLSNMYLVISGKFDQEEIVKSLRENPLINSKTRKVKFKKKEYKEPTEVVTKYQELKMNVELPKFKYNIKIKKDSFEVRDPLLLGMYINLILYIIFGKTSEFRERTKLKKFVNNYQFEKASFDDFYQISLEGESENPKKFIKEIDKEFKKIEISEEDIIRVKKLWLASEYRIADDIELLADNIFNDLIDYGKIYFNKLDLIKKINKKDLEKVIKKFSNKNKSIVIIFPNEAK